MKRKSILLVLCIGMILTSCESKISLNSTDVKNEKNQKNTTMENPDKGYNLPIDEDKKKEVVNDCEEIMALSETFILNIMEYKKQIRTLLSK